MVLLYFSDGQLTMAQPMRTLARQTAWVEWPAKPISVRCCDLAGQVMA